MKKAYKILIDLPIYPKGTIVYHEYEVLPSKFRADETYATDGQWFTTFKDYKGEEQKLNATNFLKSLVEWCSNGEREENKKFIQCL